jgi:hypothetical protein
MGCAWGGGEEGREVGERPLTEEVDGGTHRVVGGQWVGIYGVKVCVRLSGGEEAAELIVSRWQVGGGWGICKVLDQRDGAGYCQYECGRGRAEVSGNEGDDGAV